MAVALWMPLGTATAQTSTITWESAGLASGGVLTSGTTLSADGVDMTITWSTVTDGGIFLPFPGQLDFVTYQGGTQGAHTGYAALAFDNNEPDPDDKIIVTLTFSPAVTLLDFSLLDIDTGSFDDGVEIFANGVNLKGDAAVTIGTAVGLDNETYMEGYEGIGTSVATADDFGNIDLDFGTSPITTFRVEFFSTDDANANPGAQVIGISDVSFGTPTRATIDSFDTMLIAAGGLRHISGLAEALADIPDAATVGLVRWTTGQEKGTIGFDLERWNPVSASWLRLNDNMLPGLVVSHRGGSYVWVDTDVTEGRYAYRLLEREAWGTSLVHGPWDLELKAADEGLFSSWISEKTTIDGALEWWDWQRLASGFAGRGRSMSVEGGQTGNGLKRLGEALPEATRLPVEPRSHHRAGARLVTEGEGLYGIAVADLAAALDQPTGKLDARLRRARASFLAGGKPVAYAYDPASGVVSFGIDAYRTLETDTNVVQVTLGKGTVLAEAKGAGPVSGIPGEFRDSIALEENVWLLPWTNRDEGTDVWFWDFTFAPHTPTATLTFDVPDPASSGQARLRLALRGASEMGPGSDHHVSVSLNGQALNGEVAWDGFTTTVLDTTFDQSLLTTGNDVTLAIEAQARGGAATSLVLIDRIEMTYERRMRAVEGSLWIDRTGPGLTTVEGFASPEIRVIERPNDGQRAIERHDVTVTPAATGGWQVSFEASQANSFLVSDSMKAARAEPDEPSSLHSQEHWAEYLVIAPRSLENGARNLAQYRSRRFTTEVVWLEDIYDEFNYGRASSEAIETFLAFAQEQWIQPPAYIALVGRGTLDPLDHQDYGENFLPIRLATTPWGLYQSDARYADTNGDRVPEYAIGRLAVESNEQILTYVAKLATFEGLTDEAWRSRAAMVADDPDLAGDFHANSDELIGQLTSFGWSADRLYHPLDPVRENLLAGWRLGQWGLVNYDGHGAQTQLGSERYLQVTDVPDLTNQTRLPVFAAWTCAVGDSTTPGLLGLTDSLVLSPVGGAIGAVSPAGLSLDTPAHALNLLFFDAALGQGLTIGEANRSAHTLGAEAGLQPWMLDIYLVAGCPAIALGD